MHAARLRLLLGFLNEATKPIIDFLGHPMTRMHNPPHPGKALKEFMGDCSIRELAVNLGVSRSRLQRIVNGNASISADLAYRLSDAFGTSPDVWAGMQLQYDLYQAGKMKRPKIERIQGLLKSLA